MTTIPKEVAKAETLWAVNIHGPDDLIATPDYMSAVRMANAFNAWWLDLKTKQPHNDDIDARMWAVPTDWEGNDARGHADELSKPHPEYQWLREASALPHLPGVGVKKLEWRKYRNGDAEAVTPFGEIYTAYVNGYWRITRNGKAGKFIKATGGEDVDAAKAGAQADYSARILSALEPSAARELALEEIIALCKDYAEDSQPDSEYRLACNDIVEAIQERRDLSSPDHADAGKVEGDGWLPIETAPKDGTVFLAVHPHGQVDFFHWQSRGPHIGWRDSFITVYPDEAGPKIWMPIPPLPSAPASEGAE